MRNLNSKENSLLEEIKQKTDKALLNTISLLNTRKNFSEFKKKDGIDLEILYHHICKEAINRNLRFNTKGYIDLMEIVRNINE